MSKGAKPDAWMPLFIGDYLAGTNRLTTEQHGAYLLLIMDYWRNGPPPSDDAVLSQIVKLDRKAWLKHKPAVMGHFQEDAGLWRHRRIDAELSSAQGRSDRAAERATIAAEARWSKDRAKRSLEDAPSIAASTPEALLDKCPLPSPSPEEVVVVVGASPLDVHGKPPVLDDWPRTDLTAWRDALAKAAGPGLADPAKEGSLTTSMGEIHRWRVAGCSWELDVLPVIQGKTAKPTPNPIRSWTLFTERILSARDRRLAELPPPDPDAAPMTRTTDGLPPRELRPTARQINIASAQSGFAIAAQHGRRGFGGT